MIKDQGKIEFVWMENYLGMHCISYTRDSECWMRINHKHKDTNTNMEKDRETKRQIQWSGLSGLAIIVLMAPHLFQSRPAPPAVSPLNLSPKCYNYKYNHKHKDKYKYKHTNTHTPKCPVAPIKRQQIIQNTLACMLNFLKLLILQIQ